MHGLAYLFTRYRSWQAIASNRRQETLATAVWR